MAGEVIPTVATVACLSASHSTKRVFIDHIYRDRSGTWTTSPVETVDPSSGHVRRRRQTMTYLDGDEPARRQVPVHFEGEVVDLGARRRFVFVCPLCGVRVRVRGERLDEILDVLIEAADTPRIIVPLALLAARLSSKE